MPRPFGRPLKESSSLRIEFRGADETRNALLQLPNAIARKVLRLAVAAGARPVAQDLKANLKEVSMASRRFEGIGAAARSVAVKVKTRAGNSNAAYALIGARRGYSEHVSLSEPDAGDRAKVTMMTKTTVTRRGKRVETRTRAVKNLGPIARRARLKVRGGASRKRVPSRYLHLLEGGAFNKWSRQRWQGKTPLARAASSAHGAAVGAFQRVFDEGVTREFGRLAAK